MTNSTEADTVDEFRPLPPGSAERPHPYSAGVLVDIGAASDVGKTRDNNEDHFLVVRYGRAMEMLRSNLPVGLLPTDFGEIGYGMAVADGMGGAVGGEIASSLALVAGINLALHQPKWTLVLTPEEIRECLDRWRDRFKQIDAILAERSRSDPRLSGMGTTLTVAASVGAHLFLYHVGDSRAYLLRQDKLVCLTRDHTYAQALADAGQIDPSEIPRHRTRHMLTKVVGMGRGELEADIEYMQLMDGDRLLLCTDGLTEMVPDNQIADVLRKFRTSDAACHALVKLALDAGGTDNVTVVLARYDIPGGPLASDAA
jgi:protein phosphatase